MIGTRNHHQLLTWKPKVWMTTMIELTKLHLRNQWLFLGHYCNDPFNLDDKLSDEELCQRSSRKIIFLLKYVFMSKGLTGVESSLRRFRVFLVSNTNSYSVGVTTYDFSQ